MDASNENSPKAARGSNQVLSPNFSNENSPRTDLMDTSVEINGKTDNRSQQFCLRWNNHQVSEAFFVECVYSKAKNLTPSTRFF